MGTQRILGLAKYVALLSVSTPRGPYIEEHPEFHHRGLYDWLLEVAKLEGRNDPAKAAEAARLALVVAKHLDESEELRNNHLAIASAVLGNTLRLSADYLGAENALNTGWAWRKEGAIDPLIDGLLYRYEGALHSELGRYAEAEVSYNSAIIEYHHAGDDHLQGRTYLSMANTAIDYDLKKAAMYLGRANALYDPALEPFLVWCSRHIEIWILNETGKAEAALQLLQESRELYRTFGFADMWVRLRMHWVEARIAFNLGKIQESAEILSMLFRTLGDEGNHPVELTLIAVDLLHAASALEGRHAYIMMFAEELIPLLRDLGLHEQGLAVFLLLRDRLRQGVLDSTAWKTVEDYYRRHWRAPLPMEGPLPLVN